MTGVGEQAAAWLFALGALLYGGLAVGLAGAVLLGRLDRVRARRAARRYHGRQQPDPIEWEAQAGLRQLDAYLRSQTKQENQP